MAKKLVLEEIMKLAFLAPEFLPTWGGVGTYAVNLIKSLGKYPELEIHVITPRRGRDYDKQKVMDYFENRIKVHNISNANDTFFYNLNFQINMLRKFNKLNKKHKFDLVHAANLVHMPDIFLKFRRLNINSLTTVHSTLKSQSYVNGEKKIKDKGSRATVERMSSLFYFYIKFMENYYIKKTDNFITVSRWIKEKLPKEKNIFVVHNGIDTKRFKRGKKIKNDMPVILYTGRLMAMKGIYILMKAMKDILKKVDAQFIFAGTGNIKKFEKRLKGVDKKYYRFLGYVDYEKIHKLYSSSDVFVLPSLSESSPLSILEAMGCEVGVVASNVGGVPEIINDRKNGMLVEAENAKQLSEKLIYMIENEQVRKKISLNGRKLVEKKFNADIMAKNTKEVYEKILG